MRGKKKDEKIREKTKDEKTTEYIFVCGELYGFDFSPIPVKNLPELSDQGSMIPGHIANVSRALSLAETDLSAKKRSLDFFVEDKRDKLFHDPELKSEARVIARLKTAFAGELEEFYRDVDEASSLVTLLKGIRDSIRERAAMIQTASANLRFEASKYE